MLASKAPVITIDGASGTGKGAVAHLLSKTLGWHFLDSGVLYRVLALSAANHGIHMSNEVGIRVLASHLDVQFDTINSSSPKILLEGEDVTDIIRTEKVGGNASKIGVLPAVRSALLERQRAFRQRPGLVTDGRDMGTVVFPDALVKIFLTASFEERVRRRYLQLKEKGIDVNLTNLASELKTRDTRDQERAIAPLRPADNAICINSDNMSINEVVNRIMSEVQQVLKPASY